MSYSENKKENSKIVTEKKKFNIFKIIFKALNITILSILMIGTAITGMMAISFIDVIKETPVVDASRMNELMIQSSVILDKDDNLVEKIENLENRTLVSLSDMPKHLIDAFISTEDERFYSHKGVDPIGIGKSFIDTVFGGRLRGGSTIAQQLARNMYLSSEQKIERKLKEAYLALKITDSIKREGVLEAYLNRVFLGQHSYGVQAASQGYFSKDVKDLTIAESALLAAIVQSPSNFSLYKTLKPENVTEDSIVISDVNLSGQVYKAVYNPKVLDRQKYVLKKMLELKKISQAQYDEAVNEDVLSAIKPNLGMEREVSTYFTELVKSQVADKLVEKYHYSKDEAWNKIYNGGLTIHSTMDQTIQKNIENIYENFSNVMNMPKWGSTPAYVSWQRDNYGNIVNDKKNIVFYTKNNLLSSENEIIIPKGEFSINEDKSLKINSNRLYVYENVISVASYYTVNENNNLVTHGIGNFEIPENSVKVENANSFEINSSVFNDYKDFYKVGDDGNLYLSSKYFQIDEVGTLQPQSSCVVMDHHTGKIVAIVGGRETKGNPLNRAYRVPRQPGSTIKPLAVYTPALDNGYTAATAIEDAPHYNEKHELWPKNWYNGYRGWQTLRYSIVHSINVNSVKTLKEVGIEKSKEYLARFGIINKNNELSDTFVTRSESIDVNDETLASLALGAFTRGVTNLNMTGAFSAIANSGTYIEPISFTKVTDSTGKVVLEAEQRENKVTSVENTFIMTNILSDVPKISAPTAKHPTIDVAGKTGTTEEVQDSWFVGFSPYYTMGVWIGFDNATLKLNENNNQAATLWGIINKEILKDKEPKKFDGPNENIIQRLVSSRSGLLINGSSKVNAVYEYFVKGTEPKEYDNSYETVLIDSRNGKLATNLTPEKYIIEKTFYVGPGAKDSEKPPTELSELGDDEKTTKPEDDKNKKTTTKPEDNKNKKTEDKTKPKDDKNNNN